jgi:KEOPS complex subunit Cgi121
LLKYIAEAGKYVEITGFRNVGIKDAEEFVKAARKETPQSTWVQFFDAELVATWQHLYFAVLNALLAFKTERNISKSVAMEVMLYASAQRQIRKAIQLVGVKCDSENVAVKTPRPLEHFFLRFQSASARNPMMAFLKF